MPELTLSPNTIKQLRCIFREEISAEVADIRVDLKTITHVQVSHFKLLQTMQNQMTGIKSIERCQSQNLHKLTILFEDLYHRFEAVTETTL